MYNQEIKISRWKRFKRKLARVFGLALRSDLEQATMAFHIRDNMATMYWNDICDLVLDDTSFDKKTDIAIRYKNEIAVQKAMMMDPNNAYRND